MPPELHNLSHHSLPQLVVLRDCDRVPDRQANEANQRLRPIRVYTRKWATSEIHLSIVCFGGIPLPGFRDGTPVGYPTFASVKAELPPHSTAAIRAIDSAPGRSGVGAFSDFFAAKIVASKQPQSVHFPRLDPARAPAPDLLGAVEWPTQLVGRPHDASLDCVAVSARSCGQLHQGRRFVSRCFAQRGDRFPTRHRAVPSASNLRGEVRNSRGVLRNVGGDFEREAA